MPEMILTRYLYPKHNVIYSLYVSLALADLQQSLYWAYELYFSGFRTETVDLVFQIYEDFYIRDAPMRAWFSKVVEQWRQDMQPEIIGTLVENMIRREPDFAKFREKIPNVLEPNCNIVYLKKPIYICWKETPQQYQTKLALYAQGWKFPREVCQYVSYCDPTQPILTIGDYDNWLYSAAGSPIWRTRIKKYGGKVADGGSVVFPTEEAEEEFMNWFSMEPDEQPVEIEQAWLGEPL